MSAHDTRAYPYLTNIVQYDRLYSEAFGVPYMLRLCLVLFTAVYMTACSTSATISQLTPGTSNQEFEKFVAIVHQYQPGSEITATIDARGTKGSVVPQGTTKATIDAGTERAWAAASKWQGGYGGVPPYYGAVNGVQGYGLGVGGFGGYRAQCYRQGPYGLSVTSCN